MRTSAYQNEPLDSLIVDARQKIAGRPVRRVSVDTTACRIVIKHSSNNAADETRLKLDAPGTNNLDSIIKVMADVFGLGERWLIETFQKYRHILTMESEGTHPLNVVARSSH